MTSTPPDPPSSITTPNLTPTFCYTPFALRTFLQHSRAIIDDPISQQLSAFSSKPASNSPLQPFSPAAQMAGRRVSSSSRLPGRTCGEFVSRVLVPAWSERSKVIRYCGGVARQEDQGDPERGVREERRRRKREMVVDERLDPYSARFEVGESRREKLEREVREEWEVEEIVRRRSWEVLKTRCLGVEERKDGLVPVLGSVAVGDDFRR